MSLVTVKRSSDSRSSVSKTAAEASDKKKSRKINLRLPTSASIWEKEDASAIEKKSTDLNANFERVSSANNFNDLKALYSSFHNDVDKKNGANIFRKTIPKAVESANQSGTFSLDNEVNKRLSLNLANPRNEAKTSETSLRNKFDLECSERNFSRNTNYRRSHKDCTDYNRSNYSNVSDHTFSLSRIKNRQSHESAEKSSNSYGGRNLIEKYFVVKDAALILPRRSNASVFFASNNSNSFTASASSVNADESCENVFMNEETSSNEKKSPLVVCDPEISKQNSSNQQLSSRNSTGDILFHLQSMISLLRPNDTIILAVKLCSYVQDRIRYLVIVETQSNKQVANSEVGEESAILGLDIQTNSKASVPSSTSLDESNSDDKIEAPKMDPIVCNVGLILPIYANCEISLDGDGGFKFKSHQSTHIFKPVSIQAMWSAYQYLHKTFENARKNNFYSISTSQNLVDFSNTSHSTSLNQSENGASATTNHEWVKYYSALKNKNEIQVINEWYQKEERSAQREDFTTPYFDCLKLCQEQEVSRIF
jgi:hypothetical protein